MKGRRIGIQGNGPADMVGGGRVIAKLIGCSAEKVPDVGPVGIEFGRLAVALRGRFPSARRFLGNRDSVNFVA